MPTSVETLFPVKTGSRTNLETSCIQLDHSDRIITDIHTNRCPPGKTWNH
jgi:hypothetical protein